MAWIARDDQGYLYISNVKPVRDKETQIWCTPFNDDDVQWDVPYEDDSQWVELPLDADEKLIGRHITWEDEPVEI